MIEYKEESKFCDCNIQTDITLSDMTNFETYKDWYVNDCWTAFANFAKFRKDIVKTIKDEYITKSTMKKSKGLAQKHSDSKKPKHFDHENKNSGSSSIKRIKTGESSESIAIGCDINDNNCFELGSFDDSNSEIFMKNSLQKTCQIIVKTNRIKKDLKKLNHKLDEDFIQEFSCQAYLDSPYKKLKDDCSKSDGFQTDLKISSIDRPVQALMCETIATSTQTLFDMTRNTDVSMQFPPDDDLSHISLSFPLLKEPCVDVEIMVEPQMLEQ